MTIQKRLKRFVSRVTHAVGVGETGWPLVRMRHLALFSLKWCGNAARYTRYIRATTGVAVLLALATACATGISAVAQSQQTGLVAVSITGEKHPATRPARHARVTKMKIGEGAEAVWVFTPESPRPISAPVVAFLHGFGATDPHDYGGWIDHLIKNGNIVIYPVYQKSGRDDIKDVRAAAFVGLRTAFQHLRDFGPVAPINEKFGVVGHSVGGGLSVQLAALAKEKDLPQPRAVMPVEPGTGKNPTSTEIIRSIPPSVLLLAVEGADDHLKDSREGYKIISEAKQIPANRRAYVLLRSGSVNGRMLVADHYSPLAPLAGYRLEKKTKRELRRARFVKRLLSIRDGEIDELDTRGYWPLFDALLEQAFSDGSISTVLKNAGVRDLPKMRPGEPLTLELTIRLK